MMIAMIMMKMMKMDNAGDLMKGQQDKVAGIACRKRSAGGITYLHAHW